MSHNPRNCFVFDVMVGVVVFDVVFLAVVIVCPINLTLKIWQNWFSVIVVVVANVFFLLVIEVVVVDPET